ncbi:MAG: PHP domain-containing protein [Chloroflexi bacterium]|nr:PHP domain-containing protein [Chloroflexota bacterium]
MSVDLHLHSTVSDGVLTPADLVRQAAAAGLRIIALTDHDSTDGLGEAQEAARAHPRLVLIPGVEFSTDVAQGEVHILGYFIQVQAPGLQAALASFRDDRVGRARRMVERLAALGMPLQWERVLEIAGEGSIGRPHIAQALVEAGHVPSVRAAFDRLLGRNGPAYVERAKMLPSEAIALVLRAGGLAVLAHPRESPDLDRLVPELAAAGLAGMEVYYGLYPPEERARLLALARRYDLLPTGGSDYHGPGLAAECPLGGAEVPLAVGEALLARRSGQHRGR